MNVLESSDRASLKYLLVSIILIKIIGVIFATQVFARFTPLIDCQNYLIGFYYNVPSLRTQFVQWLASTLNGLGGHYFTLLSFAFISTLGLVYYYLTGGRRWLPAFTLLLPSALVWTSIVGKEAIFCGGMGLVIVVWSKFVVRSLNWYDIFIAALGIGVCALLRPHYSVALFWLFIATAVIKKIEKKALICLILLLLLGICITYFSVWQNVLERGYGAIDPMARSSRFQTLGIIAGTDEGFQQFKSMLPLGVLMGIVGPLLTEVFKRIEFLPFFIEGVLILLAPLLIFQFANRLDIPQKKLFIKNFFWCLVPAILMLMVFHAPFGFLNPGSAIRWRTNFEQMFYLAPILLVYRFIDNADC